MELKQKDRELIKHLREGKRLNISEIARQLKMPISTVNDSIKRLEAKHVIKRPSLLNYQSLGYLANAKLAIIVSTEQRPLLLDYLKQSSCVNSIYHINSGYDFLVDVVLKDTHMLKSWVSDIQTNFSAKVSTFQILKTEEIERFIP
jgi:DNA-binding Lrp family transcriptional regulator